LPRPGCGRRTRCPSLTGMEDRKNAGQEKRRRQYCIVRGTGKEEKKEKPGFSCTGGLIWGKDTEALGGPRTQQHPKEGESDQEIPQKERRKIVAKHDFIIFISRGVKKGSCPEEGKGKRNTGGGRGGRRDDAREAEKKKKKKAIHTTSRCLLSKRTNNNSAGRNHRRTHIEEG